MTRDELLEWLNRRPPQRLVDGELVPLGSWRDFERESCACDGRGWIVRPTRDYGFEMTRCPRCNGE